MSDKSSEHVIIPRTENTIKCKSPRGSAYGYGTVRLTVHQDINSELDELDREEFYRLKKVANKKQRDTAAEDEELRARKAAQSEKEKENEESDEEGPTDILGAGEDQDVIF